MFIFGYPINPTINEPVEITWNKKPPPGEEKPYPYAHLLHLWEDDYLMIELLPEENLAFIKAETQRLNDFGKAHFDGTAFNAVTEISEKPFQTADKQINISDIEIILNEAGLKRLHEFHVQWDGLVPASETFFGFGTNRFAVMCEGENGHLKNIWLTGNSQTAEEKEKLVQVLHKLGTAHGLMVVNWYCGEYAEPGSGQDDFVKKYC